MEVMSRYQVLPSKQPLPWFSGCPIQLHTVRLVQDRLADRVLLQILALNVTDQPIKSVCLRIICRDTAGTMLQDHASLLLKNVHASPHCTFRNNQTIPLTAHTSYVDLIPERIFFYDGQVWNRPDFLQGQLLPPPTSVDPDDPEAPKMQQEAQAAGLSCQYYYEEHNDFWYCSCGQANPIAAQSCGRCCGLRQWQQANMRRKAPAARPRAPRADLSDYFGRSPGQYQPILMAPQNSPAQQTPTSPAQEQLVVDPHTGELISLEKYNSLMRAMYYQKNECREPAAAPQRRSKAGVVVLIILLLLAAVAAGVFLILPQTQYGQYRQALKQMEAGNYDAAYVVFSALGNYQEAENNANFCRYCQAQMLYEKADYAAAGAIYETLTDYRNSATLAADCQYRQALAAMEDTQYESAISFLEKAQTLDGSNDIYSQKINQCYYELGLAAEQAGNDAIAITWYSQCTGYADAQQRLAACQQRLTGEDEEDDHDEDVDPSGVDTDGKSLAEMYSYVSNHMSREDETTFAYLKILCQEEYRDSKALYAELYAWKVDMFFNSSSSDLTTRLETASTGQTLYIHYIVSGGPPEGSLQMKYTYQKPNGATGEKVLSGECSAGSTGNIFWRGGIYADTEEKKAGTMTVSYYDAQTGQLLCTASIEITLPEGTETNPSP